MAIRYRPTIQPLPAFFGICAVIALFIFFSTAAVTFIMPDSYASATTVLISRAPAEASLSLTNGANGGDLGLLSETLVLRSEVVLERVAENLDLRMVWGKKYNNGMPLSRNDVVELLRRRLEISIVKP